MSDEISLTDVISAAQTALNAAYGKQAERGDVILGEPELTVHGEYVVPYGHPLWINEGDPFFAFTGHEPYLIVTKDGSAIWEEWAPFTTGIPDRVERYGAD